MKQSSTHIKILVFETYLSMIKGSVGTRLFRHLYARVGGQKKDLLRNGELSCAMFVSSILLQCQLLQEPHATVAGTLRDLQRSGWKRIRRPRVGCVVHWSGNRYADGKTHEHIGFFLGGKRAISNSSRRGVPVVHHWTYGRKDGRPARPIHAMFWHPTLRG